MEGSAQNRQKAAPIYAPRTTASTLFALPPLLIYIVFPNKAVERRNALSPALRSSTAETKGDAHPLRSVSEATVAPHASHGANSCLRAPPMADIEKTKAGLDEPVQPIISTAAKCRLYLSVGVLYLSSLAFGLAVTYSAPALADIRKQMFFSTEDSDWFGSLLNIGAVIGGLAAGCLINLIGRKRTVLLSSTIFMAGWTFIALASSPIFLFVGRFVVGLAVGMVALALPVFISEICPPNVRGLLSGASIAVLTGGILLTFILGKWLDHVWLATVSILPSFLCTVGLTFVKESPRWLYEKEREDEAVDALHFYGGPHIDHSLARLKETLSVQEAFALRELTLSYIYKPFFCTLLALFLQQFSGVCILLYFTHDIFESSGSTLSAADSSIIVGAVQFVSVGLSTLLADRVGRKILFLTSIALSCVSHIILGLFFFMRTLRGDVILCSYGWVPLFSVSLYFFGYAVGLGSLPWVLLGEILPSRVKGLATGFCTSFCFACGIVVIQTFQDLLHSLGEAGIYWFYATILACGFVLFLVFVPETKGKTLEEIEELFGKTRLTAAGEKPLADIYMVVLPI